jgi:hypothetical protein
VGYIANNSDDALKAKVVSKAEISQTEEGEGEENIKEEQETRTA